MVEDEIQFVTFNIYDVEVLGMKDKNILFGFKLAQGSEWIEKSRIRLDPITLPNNQTVWEGHGFWFQYTYKFFEQNGNT